jgi:methanogenic corrinoid protein MtbC1
VVSGKTAGEGTLHPISVVAERTGLTLDVLRVWERRYGVVTPSRDAAGRRVYRDEDIERFNLLRRASEGGRPIGKLATLDNETLAELVRADEAARWRIERESAPRSDAAAHVERAIEEVRALSADGLQDSLRRSAAVLGTASFLDEVIAPLFRRIGDDWHAGRLTVAQEHLASAVTRALLTEVRQSLPASVDAPVLVVATPAGDTHEIGALLVAAIGALEGWRVIYLGADLPAAETARVASKARATAAAISSVSARDGEALLEEVLRLSAELPAGVRLLIGGAASRQLDASALPPSVQLIDDLDALRRELRRH